MLLSFKKNHPFNLNWHCQTDKLQIQRFPKWENKIFRLDENFSWGNNSALVQIVTILHKINFPDTYFLNLPCKTLQKWLTAAIKKILPTRNTKFSLWRISLRTKTQKIFFKVFYLILLRFLQNRFMKFKNIMLQGFSLIFFVYICDLGRIGRV
jgi:hypothetical protein